jgi:hypothetical protein
MNKNASLGVRLEFPRAKFTLNLRHSDSGNGAKRMSNRAGVIMLLNNVPTEGYIHVQRRYARRPRARDANR